MKKPYLKWVGGKQRILPEILKAIGEVNGTFYDCFCGSGVVSLNTSAKNKVLNDLNRDLISCHEHVVADWKPLSFKLQTLSEEYLGIKSEDKKTLGLERKAFFESRVKNIFNNLSNPSQFKASLFLGINRLGFNGLWRVNLSGKCNVGAGSYKTIYIPNIEMKQFADSLKDAEFTSVDFEAVMNKAKRGDTIYLDPPYLKANSSRTDFSYCEGGFTIDDHIRLAKSAGRAAERGIKVVVSNADVPFSRSLYKHATKLSSIGANRSVGCKNETRGVAKEIIAIWYPEGESWV